MFIKSQKKLIKTKSRNSKEWFTIEKNLLLRNLKEDMIIFQNILINQLEYSLFNKFP